MLQRCLLLLPLPLLLSAPAAACAIACTGIRHECISAEIILYPLSLFPEQSDASYAELITQAINSSSDKRLTLSQIYEWMVHNVPYFKDKGDSNSSAGWKVSQSNGHYESTR